MADSTLEVIVNFHGIGTPHARVDDDERPYWLTFDRFDAVIDGIAPAVRSGRAAITFDDGNASDKIAAERLARRGLSARFFVLVGRVGDPDYLSADDLRALDRSGMAIGLHGRQHVDWRTLDDNALADETVTAREELAAILGRPVDEVAVPFGAYNARVSAWLHAQDFARIYTTDGGRVDASGRMLARTSIQEAFSDRDIAAILAGRHQRVRQGLRSIKARLLSLRP